MKFSPSFCFHWCFFIRLVSFMLFSKDETEFDFLLCMCTFTISFGMYKFGPAIHSILPDVEKACSLLLQKKLIYNKYDEVGIAVFGTEGLSVSSSYWLNLLIHGDRVFFFTRVGFQI